MKRFVTYLYECERGNKTKNVGFIRVNVRGEESTMEVYIRNIAKDKDEGTITALIYKDALLGIELGKIRIENGQSDLTIVIQTDDIVQSGFSIHDIEGMGIRFDSGNYIASCWKDTYAHEIVRGEFVEQTDEVVECEETEKESLLVAAQDDLDRNEVVVKEPGAVYEKIDLAQIRELPSPNWHLATNSFLVHGFWNYGYLVLKKEMEESEEKLSLGVPGIYEKPEAVMAVLFGFPDFEMVSQEMVGVKKEKNQETKEGTFGCWFVNLKL